MRNCLLVLLPALVAMPCAHADGEVQQLQQQLAQRDALIQDLLRRVEALEQKQRGVDVLASPRAPGAQAPAPASSGEEDETARALERALVREGAFVLPPGAFEAEPRYQYTYSGSRGLAVVQGAAGAQVADSTTARHRHEAALGLRVGLPWTSQLTVRAPFVHVRSSASAAAVGLDSAESGSGVGDVEVQWARQFTGDTRRRPAVLGSLTWKAANGHYAPGRASPGSGFASITAGLTAVKRQDPLVFFGGFSYTAFRARRLTGNYVEPGAGFDIRFGTLLAASPETSLRAGLELARAARARLNGAGVAGTESLSGLIELGMSSLVARNTLLDVTVGFGVTPDAPRLRIGVALPVRFP